MKLFERHTCRDKGRQTEMSSIPLFTPPMATVARARWIRSQDPRSSTVLSLPCGCSGKRTLVISRCVPRHITWSTWDLNWHHCGILMPRMEAQPPASSSRFLLPEQINLSKIKAVGNSCVCFIKKSTIVMCFCEIWIVILML